MERATPETIELWGGTLCLDFANSVDWSEECEHVAPERTDVLAEPDELERWGARLGIETPPSDAAELTRARTLRDALYRVFAREPSAPDLAEIAAAHAEAAAAGALAHVDGMWRLDWPRDDPRRVRFAVVADAVALLGDADRLARVTRCPGRHCGWLFINASGRRRWCSMSTCGSREKMRRMYHRRAAG
jgi:predicted RNA-binding Zn ribbon-like protein